MLKLAASLSKQGRQLLTAIGDFQQWQEKERKEILRRNFKHFLAIHANLSPYELTCCANYFDRENEGYLSIDQIQKKYPGAAEVQAFMKSK
jgi:hypothetical protein